MAGELLGTVDTKQGQIDDNVSNKQSAIVGSVPETLDGKLARYMTMSQQANNQLAQDSNTVELLQDRSGGELLKDSLLGFGSGVLGAGAGLYGMGALVTGTHSPEVQASIDKVNDISAGISKHKSDRSKYSRYLRDEQTVKDEARMHAEELEYIAAGGDPNIAATNRIVGNAFAAVKNLGDHPGVILDLAVESFPHLFGARGAGRIFQGFVPKLPVASLGKVLNKGKQNKFNKLTNKENLSAAAKVEAAALKVQARQAKKAGDIKLSKSLTKRAEKLLKKAPKSIAEKSTAAGTAGALAYTFAAEGGSSANEAAKIILDSKPADLLRHSREYRSLLATGLKPKAAQQELAKREHLKAGLAGGTLALLASKITGAGKAAGNAPLKSKAKDLLLLPGRTVKGYASESVEESIQGATSTLVSNLVKKRNSLSF